jgi:hypothetical protein
MEIKASEVVVPHTCRQLTKSIPTGQCYFFVHLKTMDLEN